MLPEPRGFGDREVAVIEKIAATFDTQPLLELTRRTVAKVTRTAANRSIH